MCGKLSTARRVATDQTYFMISAGWLAPVGPLAHVNVSTGPSTVPDAQVSTLLASLSSAIPTATITSATAKGSVCDTGEPISARILQLLRGLEFVELHEFLPAPLLRELRSADSSQPCGCCQSRLHLEKRQTKTVGDIFTWLLCFHRFVAAASSFHPGKLSQFMAYGNTIIRAYLEFEGDGWRAYDRAFRLQVSGRPSEDWSIINLSLYARLFTAQSRRRNSCRYCSGRDHASNQCPWGVDVAQPITGTSRPNQALTEAPICTSWNAGACRFPSACNFRHVCATCLAPHRARECPVRASRRRPAGPLPLDPTLRFRPMEPLAPR